MSAGTSSEDLRGPSGGKVSDAKPDFSRLSELASGVGLHEHYCVIYETEEEKFAAAVPYLKAGLKRGERCLYVADENSRVAVLDALAKAGTEVDRYLRTGALIIASSPEIFFENGRFDPDLALRSLSQATREEGAGEFSGLRTILGEMIWALSLDVSPDALIEFESKVNSFLRDHNVRGLCQYNRNRFSPEVILGVLRTHPVVVYGGLVCKNPYYVPPEEFLKPDQASREVERLLNNILTWEQSLDQLRALAARLQTAREEERTRVAREIHDELRQALTAIKIEFASLLRDLPEGLAASRGQSILRLLDQNRNRASTRHSGRLGSCGGGGMGCGGVSGPHGNEGSGQLARWGHRARPGARHSTFSHFSRDVDQCRSARGRNAGGGATGQREWRSDFGSSR
jgi:hypothetical protein